MATNRERKCKDRIKAEHESRMEDLRRIWGEEPEGLTEEQRDDFYAERNEYGLSFDYVAPGTFDGQRRGYFRYQLSWGGPSDEFRFFCDENRKPVRIEYWFMDWFDGAKKILSGADFDLLAEIFYDFDGCGMVEERMREALED